MANPSGVILGFDPGGTGNFGWSICETAGGELQPPARTGLANHAWQAMDQVQEALPDNRSVLAAGIDAPLFWSKAGDRTVDVELRQALRDTRFPAAKLAATVQTANSLRGACVVQGLLLAKYLSETGWGLTITESHPRALCHLLNHTGQRAMVKRLTAGLADYALFAARCLCGCEEEKRPAARPADHERDATLSAISAWAAIHRPLPQWQNLYVESRDPHRIMPFDIPISYWMPIPSP